MRAPSRSNQVSVPLVRRVHADEWQQVKALRLEALQDEAAPLAFLETYDGALAEADDFWQGRAARSSQGPEVAQFVAIDPATGRWIGTATGLREVPGTEDWSGSPIEQDQVHVVGVWVHTDHRGAGLLGMLVDGVDGWALAQGISRLRLLVHEENARAQAAYRKVGFTPTGVIATFEQGDELEMVRLGDGAPTHRGRSPEST